MAAISAVILDGVRRHRLHAPRVVVSGEDRRAAGVVDARDAAEVLSPFNYESITMCRAVFLAAFHYGEVKLHPDHLSLLGFHHESLSYHSLLFIIYDGHKPTLLPIKRQITGKLAWHRLQRYNILTANARKLQNITG